MNRPATITPPQVTKLSILLNEWGYDDHDTACEWLSAYIGRTITSRKELTVDEATAAIDTLADGKVRHDANGAAKRPPTVYQAIAAVIADVAKVGVGKHGVNREQGYQFRAIDDIMNVLAPIQAKHGVLIVPRVKSMQIDTTRTTRSGSTMIYATATVSYSIYGPAGDELRPRPRLVGMGSDTSDKATNKALTGAFKYLLGQLFAIPNTGTDGDAETPEPTVAGVAGGGQGADPDNTPPPAAGPIMSRGEIITRLEVIAKDQNMSLEELTAKFRQQHGNINVAAFKMLAQPLLAPYLRQVEEYLAAAAAAPRTDEPAPADPSVPGDGPEAGGTT